MADMRHVHADLMGAAGFELAADAGDVPALVAEPRLDGVMGDGLAAVAAHRLLQPVVAGRGRAGRRRCRGPVCVAPQAKAV